MRAPRVSIVGAGIVGASVAYHLTLAGARVALFDAASGPARGVTARAFGWVNLVHGNPADPVAYGLRRQAIAEHERLARALPEAFRAARRGSLVWKETAAATEDLVRRHRSAGASIEIIERAAIRAAEPHLRDVPAIAALSPADLAVNPVRITEALISATVEAGAEAHWQRKVLGLETSGARVRGIRVSDRVLDADVVVLAGGPDTDALLSPLGIDIGLARSPAVLLRFTSDRPLINHIVNAPDLEIRETERAGLWVADSHDGDASGTGLQAAGRRALEAITRRFGTVATVVFDAAHVGSRPVFADGLPRLGFLSAIDGLYIAVGHPGVILTPLLGRLASEEIVAGKRSSLLASRSAA